MLQSNAHSSITLEMSILIPEPVPTQQWEFLLAPGVSLSWALSPPPCLFCKWFLCWGPSFLCIVQLVAPSPPLGIYSADVCWVPAGCQALRQALPIQLRTRQAGVLLLEHWRRSWSKLVDACFETRSFHTVVGAESLLSLEWLLLQTTEEQGCPPYTPKRPVVGMRAQSLHSFWAPSCPQGSMLWMQPQSTPASSPSDSLPKLMEEGESPFPDYMFPLCPGLSIYFPDILPLSLC